MVPKPRQRVRIKPDCLREHLPRRDAILQAFRGVADPQPTAAPVTGGSGPLCIILFCVRISLGMRRDLRHVSMGQFSARREHVQKETLAVLQPGVD